jgi:hypothetical protein
MYLARITIETRVAPRYSAEYLHGALLRTAAATDRLQHARIDIDGACIVFFLYLQAHDKLQAGAVAGQLCRRTMAGICWDGAAWSIRSTQVGP